MELVLTHKHGKTIRHAGKKQWIHLRDLCGVLGLSPKPNLKNKPTKKFRALDKTNRSQLATYIHKSCLDSFLVRSQNTDKVVWLREEVFGIKPPRKPHEEKSQPPPPVPRVLTAGQNPYDKILELQYCLTDIYENFSLSRSTKKRIRELVPDIKPPPPPAYRYNNVEVEKDKNMIWLVRTEDGRAFVELAVVLALLESPIPIESYTEDETYQTVTHRCVKMVCSDPYEDRVELTQFIEIKHMDALEEHARRTNRNLQAAIDDILRSLPG